MPVITSTANPAVKAARKLGRGSAHRDRGEDGRGGDRLVLVEGGRGVEEALAHLRRLFVTADGQRRHARLVGRVRDAGAQVLTVSDDVLGSVADAVTPQGLVGVAALPSPGLQDALGGLPAAGGLVVVCCEVADPGNAGAVLRSADAAGAHAVVLTAGSVDVGNPKVVRASAGSLFHLPVVTGADTAELLAGCRARGIQLVATAADAPLAYTDVDFTRPTAMLLGNEARGLDPDVRAACDVAARVPVYGRAESLNLAATAAVVVYEAARQRARAR